MHWTKKDNFSIWTYLCTNYFVPGCILAFRALGPALGFALGSGCLSVYIDPSVTPVITKKDPRWLGAWWLGESCWHNYNIITNIKHFARLTVVTLLEAEGEGGAKNRSGCVSCRVDISLWWLCIFDLLYDTTTMLQKVVHIFSQMLLTTRIPFYICNSPKLKGLWGGLKISE